MDVVHRVCGEQRAPPPPAVDVAFLAAAGHSADPSVDSKSQASSQRTQPIHLFNRSLFLSPLNVIPIPDALRDPCLVDVVHQVSGRPGVAPRSWVAAAGRWGTNQTMSTGGTLVIPVWVHTGDVHCFKNQCHSPSPILYSIALQWSEWTEMALI